MVGLDDSNQNDSVMFYDKSEDTCSVFSLFKFSLISPAYSLYKALSWTYYWERALSTVTFWGCTLGTGKEWKVHCCKSLKLEQNARMCFLCCPNLHNRINFLEYSRSKDKLPSSVAYISHFCISLLIENAMIHRESIEMKSCQREFYRRYVESRY